MLKTNYAVYPYNKDIVISETGVITTVFPAEQHYAVNSYGLGDNTMVAVTKDTDDTFLQFKNVGGCLKLQLYGENITVRSIKLKGNNSEKIAGNATVLAVYGMSPVVSMADDAETTITLDCGDKGVRIGTSAEEATAFWVVLPPVTFTKGITVMLKDVENKVFAKTTEKELIIERNVVKPMTAVVVKNQVPNDEIPYLTFTADAVQTLTMSQAVETLEYSVGGSNWAELGATTVTFGGENGELRLRGKNLGGTASSYNNNATITFGNTVPVSCTGDIRTLVDYENHTTVNTGDARFCNLFKGCSGLTSAPQLPATELADYCYTGLFEGCTNLIEAPEIPAENLTEGCYGRMFYGCTNLKETPELPATRLAEACYALMFQDCISLKKAPELPVTDLAEGCYLKMFYYCTNLAEAPELPATTMVGGCYQEMFWGCTSLTEAPELPAITLADYCYDGMFGETGLTKAPELPVAALAKYCYAGMFSGCTNLTEAPELPATIMVEGCYQDMFSNCKNLVQAPELPAKTLAEGCYQYMFYHCENLLDAPELPAMTLAESCYQYMFAYCKNLTMAPLLRAPVLTQYCYDFMFVHCSKLNNVTMLATDISATECLRNWLFDVSSTGTFTKAEEMVSLPSGGDGIPEGWTVRNY